MLLVTSSRKIQIEYPVEFADRGENEANSLKAQIFQLEVDENPRNSDGLILHGWDGATPLRAFISRRVMDDWVDPRRTAKDKKSLFREEYNALGKRNLAAIKRIVVRKYRRGPAFNPQHPFVDVLLADIVESGEVLDVSEMLGAALSSFKRTA